MDFIRLKKAIAGVSVAAITLTQVGTALAAYSDVPTGVWYKEAVDAFVDAGYLDASQPRFRGGDHANRAEFVKLIVELNGGVLSTPPAVPSFDDVSANAWYYSYMEEAGKEGWVRGDGDCYGSRPCYARPGANINRAEAAALIVRAFGLAPTGDAPQFVDNPSGQWYTEVIQTAADHCVLQGDDTTGRVRPADSMNRAEMVVMLYRVDLGLVYGVDCGVDQGSQPMVTDVVPTSATTLEVEFNQAVDEESATDPANYTVTGSDIPVDSVVMVNATTVEITLAMPMDPGHEYTLSVQGVFTVGGGEVVDAMLFLGYTALVRGDGILEVTLSASNPVSDTVPKGAVGVVMLSVDFTASCDDSILIENLTVLHEGFGDEVDISGVYAAINGARVTRKRTIDSEDQTADLRFASPLVLDPCESVTVDLVTDFVSTATTAAEHNFVVELPSDIFGNAREVRGNFPVRGNTFRIAAVTSGVVTVEYRTVTPDEVEVGDVGVVIGKFEVSINSVEDQTFYSMTFEQDSSASDGDYVNIAVRRTDGTVLTNTVSQSVGDFSTVVYDPPFTVLEGDKITLEIIADIVGGAGDSIIMHFEESSDLFAVGSLYGYGVNGQLYGSQIALPTESATLPDTVTIDAGEFTIGIQGPPTQDYTRDDNDAVLANIGFQTGGEDVDIKDLFVLVQAQTSTGGSLETITTGSFDNVHEVLEDVEVRNKSTGRTIDGVRLTGSSDSGLCTKGVGAGCTSSGTFQIYRFDDFIVRGDEQWEFRTDFIDNGAGNHPRNGDRFRIHVCGEPTHILSAGSLITNTTGCSFGGVLASASTAYQMQVEGLSTGDKVGDVRPRGNIAGNFHRIANATLTIAVKSLNSTDNAVENAKNIVLFRFEARAGEAEDVLFTKAVFNSKSGSLLNGQNYTLWVDQDGDSQVDTILEEGIASQSGQIPFADLIGGGFVIPREETVIFEVHADVASTLTNSTLQIQFATGSTTSQITFLEAEELDDGSNLSGIKVNSTILCCGSTLPSTADVTVTTADGTAWHLVNQGDLFVTLDTTLRSRQLLGGALGEAVLRLQFHAENEDVDVTDLQLTSSGTTATSIDRLELYKDAETTPFALATIGGCGSDDVVATHNGNSVRTFCANMEQRQLIVTQLKDVDVSVRPRLKNDTAGGTTNQALRFWLSKEARSDESTGSGAVRARGDESSNNLIANDGDTTSEGEVFIGTASATTNAEISGARNVSVMAKITSIVDVNPDSAQSNPAVPTGVSNIGWFKITAADHNNSNNGDNDVSFSGALFNVNATNVAIDVSTLKLFNASNQTITQTCTAMTTAGVTMTPTASGVFLVGCTNLRKTTIDVEVDKGTSETYILQANVTNAKILTASTSTLQVSLSNFDSIGNTSYGISTSHFEWVDKDGTVTQDFFWVESDVTVVKSTAYQS